MIDYGFDMSSFGRIEPGLIDTSIFKTIQDFLDYPTGYSMPTYQSGSGMTAETWENRFTDYVRSYVWDWIAQSDFQNEIEDKNGDIDDYFHDELGCSQVNEYAFSEWLGERPFPVLRLIKLVEN